MVSVAARHGHAATGVAHGALALVAVAAAVGWALFGRTPATPPAAEVAQFGGRAIKRPLGGGKSLLRLDRATPKLNIWLQQVDGGQAAVQLTRHEGDAVTRHSHRTARGSPTRPEKDENVYVIATVGGEPRKVAPQGFNEVLARRIAARYSSPGFDTRLMLVSAVGGQPTRVSENFNGGAPLWSRDGSHLLATGRVDPKGSSLEAGDWFAISVKDGTAVRLGAAAALRTQKVIAATDAIPIASDWTGDAVLFTVNTADGAEVWRLRVNPATFALEGAAEQVTFGTARKALRRCRRTANWCLRLWTPSRTTGRCRSKQTPRGSRGRAHNS
jgi:hypothetical protein